MSALQKVANFNFPEGLLNDFRVAAQCPVDRSWCAQRCCDEAATESLLRRSRCCDGAAQTSSVALILMRVAYGADVAATELRRSRCCDGAAQNSSVALILRVASRRDALNEEPASFPPGDSNFNSWPTVLGHPPGPVITAVMLVSYSLYQLLLEHIGSMKNVKEDRAQTREMGGMDHGNAVSMRLIRVDTIY